MLRMLKSQEQELYGLDMSPNEICRARTHGIGYNLYVGDARWMPFASDSSDYITSTDVLEYFAGDDVLRGRYRVLRQKGTALLVAPNGKGPWGKATSHVRFFTFQSFVVFV